MDKSLVYGLIGGLVGIIVMLLVTNYSVNNQNYGMMRIMGMRRGVERMVDEDECPMMENGEKAKEMSVNQMFSRLATLKDDEFDKEFMKLMIGHHKGAIDMAELVLTNSNREQL